MGVTSLPKTVTRQRRGCDLNPGPSAPKSSTLTTQLPSRRYGKAIRVKFDTDLLKAVAVVHRTQKQLNRHLLMMMSAHNAPVRHCWCSAQRWTDATLSVINCMAKAFGRTK